VTDTIQRRSTLAHLVQFLALVATRHVVVVDCDWCGVPFLACRETGSVTFCLRLKSTVPHYSVTLSGTARRAESYACAVWRSGYRCRILRHSRDRRT